MNDLENLYCIFSRVNGAFKRFFQLSSDGKIVDLFSHKGHDNERYWKFEESRLFLLSRDFQITSSYELIHTEENNGGYTFLGKTIDQKHELRVIAYTRKSDLFEGKTKFRNIRNIENGTLQVGDNTYGLVRLIDAVQGSGGKVIIGDYCSIASGTIFIVGNHKIDLVTTYPFKTLNQYYSDIPVSIDDHAFKTTKVGNDVWIGINVCIMAGITIGDGAVIAANSVVTKNVDSYSIVAGNPARHIKYRVEDLEHRQKLLNIAWWNWTEQKIAENINKIMSDDIGRFIEEFEL